MSRTSKNKPEADKPRAADRVNCPRCGKRLRENNAITASVISLREDGKHRAKCRRCKTWVVVSMSVDLQ